MLKYAQPALVQCRTQLTPFLVLYLPNVARPESASQRRRYPPRPQAFQPSPKRKLRSQSLRLWSRAVRENG